MSYTVADALQSAMGVRRPEGRERLAFVVLRGHPTGRVMASLSVGASRQTLVARAQRWRDEYGLTTSAEVRYVDQGRLGDDYEAVCHDVLADLYAATEAQS
jgi:hypothetical protein